MKILIADDHEIVREGLTRLLDKHMDMAVVGYAENGLEALSQIKSLTPDILIMDTEMPVLSGLDAVPLIHKEAPDTKIILFSINKTDEYIYKSFNSGAIGYVLKLSSSKDILDSIHAAVRGEHYVSPLISSRIFKRYRTTLPTGNNGCRYNLLTNREQNVFRQIVEGYSDEKIATTISSTPSQVLAIRQSISDKIQLHDFDDMISYAENIGIIMPKCWSDDHFNSLHNSLS